MVSVKKNNEDESGQFPVKLSGFVSSLHMACLFEIHVVTKREHIVCSRTFAGGSLRCMYFGLKCTANAQEKSIFVMLAAWLNEKSVVQNAK